MKRVLALLIAFAVIINPAVMHQFYADGGSIHYADSVTYYGQPAFGTIHYRDLSIRIANDAPDGTLAHEMGHYLYHKQVWSGELQEHANQAFASCPLRTCDPENFAVGYEMYCFGKTGTALTEFYRLCEGNLS